MVIKGVESLNWRILNFPKCKVVLFFVSFITSMDKVDYNLTLIIKVHFEG